MTSRATSKFWKSFNVLPVSVQEKARRAFRLWSENPAHTSLHFKKIHPTEDIFSVRIDLHYRALGVKHEDVINYLVLNRNSRRLQ